MIGAASEEDLAFQTQIRGTIERAYRPELRAKNAVQAGIYAEPELAREWAKILYGLGWSAPAWPTQYGGTGWTWRQREIFQRECSRADTPLIPGMGLNLCGPVIMRYGTEEQKAFFLPRILSGEHYWAQGYSEPQAGSDLASVQMRAVRDGDDYVLNGSKIWTTHGHAANWIFLLVRTRTEGKRQQGITFLVSPMDAPGITVRPIISMSGEHEVNQIFFDDVRVPVANRLGEENEGWTVAKYLLEFERGAGVIGASLMAGLDIIKRVSASEPGGDGRPLSEDAIFQQRVAKLEIDLMAVDWTERMFSTNLQSGESMGHARASIKKLLASTYIQRVAELMVETIGIYGAADQRRALGLAATESVIGPQHALTAMAKYLNTRARTIFGGSSEVQHSIIASEMLGLR
jgi:alkylation response protein AidB-like acyl-CoA dehydrogenase